MGAFIEVSYCSLGSYGKSYGSGSTRMYEGELAKWLSEQLASPVLVTDIRVIHGEIGMLAKAS